MRNNAFVHCPAFCYTKCLLNIIKGDDENLMSMILSADEPSDFLFAGYTSNV